MITFRTWRKAWRNGGRSGAGRAGDPADGDGRWPLWRPLLIAAVLAGVLSPLYERAVGGSAAGARWPPALFTAATVLLILIPLTALAIVAIREAIDAVASCARRCSPAGSTA